MVLSSVLWLVPTAAAQFCKQDVVLGGDLGEAIRCIRESGDPSVCDPSALSMLRSVGILPRDIDLLADGWWVSGFACEDGQRRAVVRIPRGWFGNHYVVYPERFSTDDDYRKLRLFRSGS